MGQTGQPKPNEVEAAVWEDTAAPSRTSICQIVAPGAATQHLVGITGKIGLFRYDILVKTGLVDIPRHVQRTDRGGALRVHADRRRTA